MGGSESGSQQPGDAGQPTFGALLRRYRLAAGLSQERLAERAGISAQALSALENGKRQAPYRHTVTLLARALGLSEAESAALEAAIVRSRLPAGATTALLTLPAQSSIGPGMTEPAAAPLTHSARTNLPVQLSSFIGREREQGEVRALLNAARLVTLTGAGGAGKTRLALAVAGAVLNEYLDGAWLVELAALADPAPVPQAVAGVLGLHEVPHRPLLATLITHLTERRLLLVLDNCEHLVGACAELVAALLQSCAQLRILATSRETLGVPGETTYRVPSLAVPDLAHLPDPERLPAYAAVDLFVQRARSRRPDFMLSVQNAPAVAEICVRLDGMPLAIELAAARVGSLPVEAIAARLDDRFRLLTGGPRIALSRQQTLRAALDWSHDLLGDAERVLLRRLSVFAGGWTLEAAESVCAGDGVEDGEILDLLDGLVNKSLVLLEDGAEEPRYHLLETIRQYAAEKLAAGGEGAGMACSHARYFTALAEEARPHLTRAEQLVWLPRLDREGDNLRAAQGWCLVQGQACDGEATELGLRLGWALWVYRHFRGQFREARAWLQQLLSLPTPTTRTAHRAAALAPAGFYSVIAGGDTTRAVALLEESLTLAREARRTEVAAIALAWLGAVVPDLARRQTLLEEGVTLGRTLGNSVELRFALIFLGLYHLGVGDHSLASDYFTQSRAAALAVGDRWTTSIACDGLAQVARARGDTETARRLFAEELALHRELEDKHGIGHTLRFLGELAEEQGDAEGAETCYAEALTMLRDAWDVDRLTAVLRGVAALALVREQPARALRLAGAVTTARAVFTVQSAADTAAGWEHIGEAARTRLSAVVAATAWDEGQAMSLEQAITYALQGAPQVADTP